MYVTYKLILAANDNIYDPIFKYLFFEQKIFLKLLPQVGDDPQLYHGDHPPTTHIMSRAIDTLFKSSQYASMCTFLPLF